jgi:superfamily II DNA/RNA helicase
MNTIIEDKVNIETVNIEENQINTWDEMGLKDEILRGIYSYGYEIPSDIQKKTIPIIIKGTDMIAQAQSGMGKTGAFSISVLQRIDIENKKTQVIILEPTHELVKQTAHVIKSLGAMMDGLQIKTMVGGTSIQDDISSIKENTPHIVIGSIGRVYDMFRRKILDGKDLKILVLDEADVMLSQEFKMQIYNMFQYLNQDMQVLLFSATFSEDVLNLTQKFMRNPEKIVMKSEELSLECIKQYYIAMQNDYMKYETMKDIFTTISISQCFIYCNSIKRVAELYEAMTKDGFSVGAIHGSMEKVAREKEFVLFKNGTYRVMISSDITARGIDIQHLSTVINFDIPKDVHTYLHRIGRSGRWGRKGLAINFITKRDVHCIKNIEKYYNINMEELPSGFGEYINS